MSLRAKAKLLAQPFVWVRSYFRGQFESMRYVGRMMAAARTRPPAELRAVAIHEAGHAVAYIASGLNFGAVSIVPNIRAGADGQVFHVREDPTAGLQTDAREALYLRYAMIYYAGAEAVRQLIPTHPNPDAGASADWRHAANLISKHIGGAAESKDLLFSLAKRRCAMLVAHHRAEIEALADALQANLVLTGKAARKVFERSLMARSGRLLTFKTDPILHGVTGDEAFRAFLRKMNLPD